MFNGFTQQTIDFMWGIRFNNNRDWFEAHKQEYLDHLYRPMKELCEEVYGAIDGQFPQLGLKCRVCRIYRDARRLHGKGPYKDHLWWTLERPFDGDLSSQPVFWFELAPDSWSYGLGYYAARALTMAKYRARMDRNPVPMKELARLLASQSEFILDGPGYAKEKTAPDAELAQWYNKKSFSLLHEERPLSDTVFDPTLGERLAEGFRFLMPFYSYFSSLDSDPDPRE